MALFNHRPARTNWLRALPGDRSGGFSSPYGKHNPSVTSLSPGWGDADILPPGFGVQFQHPDAENPVQDAAVIDLLRGAQGGESSGFQDGDPVCPAQGQGQVVEDHRHRLSTGGHTAAQCHEPELVGGV